MQIVIRAVIFLLAGLHLFPAAAEELQNDLSRGDLFELLARPAGGGDSALPLPFTFPADARNDSIFGIDISHHTEDGCGCRIDWQSLSAQKVAFAYLKASQAARFVDSSFARNWSALGLLSGVHRGAYHFLSADVNATAQAEHFLKLVGELKSQDLPPTLDIEWDFRFVNGAWVLDKNGQKKDFWSDLAPGEIINRIAAWLQLVEKVTKRTPVIYTNRAWWMARVQNEALFASFHRYPIWTADYSTSGRGQEKPQVPNGDKWTLWQFTERGQLSQGVALGKVDVSIFKGTHAEFRQSLGLR